MAREGGDSRLQREADRQSTVDTDGQSEEPSGPSGGVDLETGFGSDRDESSLEEDPSPILGDEPTDVGDDTDTSDDTDSDLDPSPDREGGGSVSPPSRGGSGNSTTDSREPSPTPDEGPTQNQESEAPSDLEDSESTTQERTREQSRVGELDGNTAGPTQQSQSPEQSQISRQKQEFRQQVASETGLSRDEIQVVTEERDDGTYLVAEPNTNRRETPRDRQSQRESAPSDGVVSSGMYGSDEPTADSIEEAYAAGRDLGEVASDNPLQAVMGWGASVRQWQRETTPVKDAGEDLRGLLGVPSEQEAATTANEFIANRTDGTSPREARLRARGALLNLGSDAARGARSITGTAAEDTTARARDANRGLLSDRQAALLLTGAALAEPTPFGEAILLGTGAGLGIGGATATGTDQGSQRVPESPFVQREFDAPEDPADEQSELDSPSERDIGQSELGEPTGPVESESEIDVTDGDSQPSELQVPDETGPGMIGISFDQLLRRGRRRQREKEKEDDDLGVPDDDPYRVSDRRLYDPSRTFGDDVGGMADPDIDAPSSSNPSRDDIEGGISGQGDPQPADGVDLGDGGFSERGFGESITDDATERIEEAEQRFDSESDDVSSGEVTETDLPAEEATEEAQAAQEAAEEQSVSPDLVGGFGDSGASTTPFGRLGGDVREDTDADADQDQPPAETTPDPALGEDLVDATPTADTTDNPAENDQGQPTDPAQDVPASEFIQPTPTSTATPTGFGTPYGFSPPNTPGSGRPRRPRPDIGLVDTAADTAGASSSGSTAAGAGDPFITAGWISETVATIATAGRGVEDGEVPDEARRTDADGVAAVFGEFPTAAQLSTDEETQADIQSVQALLSADTSESDAEEQSDADEFLSFDTDDDGGELL